MSYQIWTSTWNHVSGTHGTWHPLFWEMDLDEATETMEDILDLNDQDKFEIRPVQ